MSRVPLVLMIAVLLTLSLGVGSAQHTKAEEAQTILISATPTVDIASYKPVTIQGLSPVTGTWSISLFSPQNVPIATLPTATGTTFSSLWTPPESYQIPGPVNVAALLTHGLETETGSTSFALYNFPIKITQVKYYNGSFQPIDQPSANNPFFVMVEGQNISSLTIPTAFVHLKIGEMHAGIGGVGNILPQNIFSCYVRVTLPSGTFPIRAFIWGQAMGMPISSSWAGSISVKP
ncbi:MAG: hypothetical protein WCP58_10885 [bacterium]